MGVCLTARGSGAVCYGVSTDNSSTCGNVGCDEELSPTLQVKKRASVIYGKTQYIVRRLTPLESCRLQGMPDWWEEGVSGSDIARYKMWGNGMALPNALYVMEGLIPSIVAEKIDEVVAEMRREAEE